MDYKRFSAEAVQHFLKTAVIVDERAFKPYRASQVAVTEDNLADQINTDDGEMRGSSENFVENEKVPSGEDEGPEHDLETESVVRSFAEKGMICAVLSPRSDDDETTRNLAITSANQSDVAVFDWQIHGDNGDYTLSTIGKLIDSNKDATQLRLIVIYTGVPETNVVLDKIQAKMSENAVTLSPAIGARKKENCLSNQFLRICVLTKPGAAVETVGSNVEVVDFEKLAERVIEEFCVMTPGLLRGLTLYALAALRSRAASILAQVSDKLDPAFLTHRMLLLNPDDSQEHAIAYLSEEFRSVLDEYEVASKLNFSVTESWLEDNATGQDKVAVPPHFHLERLDKDKLKKESEIPTSEVSAMLKNGIEKWRKSAEGKTIDADAYSLKQFIHYATTKMLTGDEAKAWESDALFSIFTSLETKYIQSRIPMLTFGSIVYDYEQKSYLLCIQPLCDCIRLEKPHAFPFLPFKKSVKQHIMAGSIDYFSPYDLVIHEPNPDTFIALRLMNKSYCTQMITFKPDKSTSIVRAEKDGEEFVFKSIDMDKNNHPSAKRYRWIGNMKVRQTQRIVNRFGAYISRVGINESEWLRRAAGGETIA